MKATKQIKYSIGLVAVTMIMAVLTACGNNGSSNNNGAQQQVYPNCVNCQVGYPGQVGVGGATFFQASSQDIYGLMSINWSFMAQGAIAQNQYQYNNGGLYGGGYNYGGSIGIGYGYNYGGTSPIISYSGPVTAAGTIAVQQNVNLGNCYLPAGTYSLNSISQGQWSSAMVYNLRMQASGPASIVMTLSQGQVAAKTGAQLGQLWSEINPVGRIFGNLVLESINGMACYSQLLIQ